MLQLGHKSPAPFKLNTHRSHLLNMFCKLLIPIYLALTIAASPVVVRNSPVSVPLARRFNVTGAKNVLAADQARAKFLKGGAKSARKAAGGSGSIPLTNAAVTYTAAVCAPLPFHSLSYRWLMRIFIDRSWQPAHHM